MPFYDFRCERCGHVEEFLLAIDAPGPATHEGCGGGFERVYAPTSIHFKGSGWAKLDRRGDSGPSGGSSSGDTTSSPSSTPSAPATPKAPSTPKSGGD